MDVHRHPIVATVDQIADGKFINNRLKIKRKFRIINLYFFYLGPGLVVAHVLVVDHDHVLVVEVIHVAEVVPVQTAKVHEAVPIHDLVVNQDHGPSRNK